jgi:hypothetical protein
MADHSTRITRRERLALAGLSLPAITLERIKKSGIYCVPRLSVAFQSSTKRHVIRAHESGGAVSDLGLYCGVVSESGAPLPWLQRIETIGVNGLHARAVASSLIRIQVLRVRHTYDLLVTKHTLATVDKGARATLANSILFYGRQGTLQMDLWGKDASFRGHVCPVFYDRGGDRLTIPAEFEQAVRDAIAGVCCCGCEHTHLLAPPEMTTAYDVATPPVTSAAD